MSSKDTKFFIRVRGKILGPFDVGQLRSLRARGRFSRVHEYSTDRRNWKPASQLSAIFLAESDNATDSTEQTVDYSDSSHETAKWHYLSDGEEQGPISRSKLLALIKSGQLDPNVHVWSEGFEQWSPVTEVDELRDIVAVYSRKNRASRFLRRAILIASILVVLAIPVGVVVQLTFRDEIDAWFRGGSVATTIEGAAAEELLAETLGFVVCGLRVISQDGTLREIPQSTGSCFMISPDGYAITNKHVIAEIEKLMRAELLLNKIRDELLVKVEPKIWVFIDQKQYSAKIAHSSGNFDLAILKVDSSGSSFLKLAGDQTLQRGKRVYALGFPAAAQSPLSTEELYETIERLKDSESVKERFKARDFEFIQTDGTVSRVTSEENGRTWIQHTADINPGNSGGPLVTDDGIVRGVNTLVSQSAAGVSYSVSLPQLRTEIAQFVPNAVWE